VSTQKPVFRRSSLTSSFKKTSSASRRSATEEGRIILYGWHPVRAALCNPHRTGLKLTTTDNALHRLQDEKISLPETVLVRPQELERRLPPDAVHQGLLLEADPLPSLGLEDIPETGLVLMLDQITDPHNVGAILRSAAAFQVSALVTTHRHSPAATGVLAKAASGGLEHVPLINIGNLSQGLIKLGERGFTRIGLDSAGEDSLTALALKLSRPLVLVLGAEGKGLRHLTRERCDHLARIPVPGAITSLNVSNAAAIALFCLLPAGGAMI
jgi:23S rRNA (guanosine2251-2'-O)-methyltransferase